MNKKPILILQMQRMGDLVLTFPLLGWLMKCYPGHPIWVVGETDFYKPLMSLSPPATYFSYDAAPGLLQHDFLLVINLSFRHMAAILAGGARAEEKLGPCLEKDGATRIMGNWQLYRASLTDNNRHNLFHWADLNALDCIPLNIIRRTVWPKPRQLTASEGARIGLFLGASEHEKRPEPLFFAGLAARLINLGHKPVFLGGADEKELGKEASRILGSPALDMTGHFSISELAEFLARLDLLITPDTGPMHVAVWSGTPTINLSMGPVNAWETGPFSPRHHILRPRMSCVGCWRCQHKDVLCRRAFSTDGVASIADLIVRGEMDSDALSKAAGSVELLKTDRDGNGLYNLVPSSVHPDAKCMKHLHCPTNPLENAVRMGVSRFWQAWFGYSFGIFKETAAREAWNQLGEISPEVPVRFKETLFRMTRQIALCIRRETDILNNRDFWKSFPRIMRPLSGYFHLYLQNESCSRQSFLHALAELERLGSCTAG